MELDAHVTLWTEYLPTETLTCSITDAGVASGSISHLYGTSYTVSHSNPSCDGYPSLYYGNDPNHSYSVSSALTSANATVAAGAEAARPYWGNVGSSLWYTTLSTPSGSESQIVPHPSPSPGVIGELLGNGNVGLNTSFILSQSQWAYITAHELGHAIGFGHAGGSSTHSIMADGSWPVPSDLSTRVGDKCGSVRAFQVDLTR